MRKPTCLTAAFAVMLQTTTALPAWAEEQAVTETFSATTLANPAEGAYTPPVLLDGQPMLGMKPDNPLVLPTNLALPGLGTQFPEVSTDKVAFGVNTESLQAWQPKTSKAFVPLKSPYEIRKENTAKVEQALTTCAMEVAFSKPDKTSMYADGAKSDEGEPKATPTPDPKLNVTINNNYALINFSPELQLQISDSLKVAKDAVAVEFVNGVKAGIDFVFGNKNEGQKKAPEEANALPEKEPQTVPDVQVEPQGSTTDPQPAETQTVEATDTTDAVEATDTTDETDAVETTQVTTEVEPAEEVVVPDTGTATTGEPRLPDDVTVVDYGVSQNLLQTNEGERHEEARPEPEKNPRYQFEREMREQAAEDQRVQTEQAAQTPENENDDPQYLQKLADKKQAEKDEVKRLDDELAAFKQRQLEIASGGYADNYILNLLVHERTEDEPIVTPSLSDAELAEQTQDACMEKAKEMPEFANSDFAPTKEQTADDVTEAVIAEQLALLKDSGFSSDTAEKPKNQDELVADFMAALELPDADQPVLKDGLTDLYFDLKTK